jgi:hypothetical protein
MSQIVADTWRAMVSPRILVKAPNGARLTPTIEKGIAYRHVQIGGRGGRHLKGTRRQPQASIDVLHDLLRFRTLQTAS